MGAKFWFVAISDGDAREHLKKEPAPDREATRELAEKLFPGCREAPDQSCSLGELLDPRGADLFIAAYPGVSIVAAEELGIDLPSQLPDKYLDLAKGKRISFHAQHSVVDWTAFALWEDGQLVRSVSVSPDGVAEVIGDPFDFEAEFWDPTEEIYDLPFGHPLELGEDALLHFLGFQYEGHPKDWLFDPDKVEVPVFKRGRTGLLNRLFRS